MRQLAIIIFPAGAKVSDFPDTMVKGLAPLDPLGPAAGKVGPIPRLANGNDPVSFYLALCALVLTAPRAP